MKKKLIEALWHIKSPKGEEVVWFDMRVEPLNLRKILTQALHLKSKGLKELLFHNIVK